MCCFLKKDGSVRKNYYEAVKYLLTAEMEHREIMCGPKDEITNEYDCYTTKLHKYYEPKRSRIKEKVNNICSEFSCMTKTWYSLPDIRIELHGNNVKMMLDTLKKYLRQEES